MKMFEIKNNLNNFPYTDLILILIVATMGFLQQSRHRLQHQYIDLFQNLNNLNNIAENAPTTLLFTTTSFRMLNFYWNRTRYVNLTKAMTENITNVQKFGDEKIKQIVSGSVKYMWRLTILFWISALVTGNMMCIKSAFDVVLYHFREQTVVC